MTKSTFLLDGQPVPFEEGQTIIEKGGDPNEIFFLANGIVGVVLRKENTMAFKQVSSFSPGMSFGELGLLLDEPRTADVVAITDVAVYSLNREQMDHFRDLHPEGYRKILLNALHSMSNRLLRANREVAALK